MPASIAPIHFYVGDDWQVSVTATDGTTGLGAVQIIEGGQYASPPTVVFGAPPTGGRIATGTATLDQSGAVSGVALTDPGVYAPGQPPSLSFTGGGGGGAIGATVVGNIIDLTGTIPGAELFLAWNATAIDLTVSGNGSVSMPAPTSGVVTITVARLVTLTALPLTLAATTSATRIHVFFIDASGKRHTVGVIPIIPLQP